MTQCPKCSSCKISGPRYGSNWRGHERLFYDCTRCGYISNKPTHDQKYDQSFAGVARTLEKLAGKKTTA